jgi:hypothetical protein
VSARLGISATYRGWSVSGSIDQSIESTATSASELLATYSHKLPHVDLHIGLTHAQIDGIYADNCTLASLSASSNNLSRTKFDLTVQGNSSGTCTAVTIGASQELWKLGPYQIDLRASASSWETDSLSTDGWSLRLLGRWQLKTDQSLHFHIGYINSTLNRGFLQSKPSGPTLGINYVWEFRL